MMTIHASQDATSLVAFLQLAATLIMTPGLQGWPTMRNPKLPATLGRMPSRPELLDLLDALELALSDLTRRWDNGIPAEIRAEIMIQAYEPVLRMLMRARRRPVPR